MAPKASKLVKPGLAVAGAQTDCDITCGQMKAAMALRVKYRTAVTKRRICIMQMGVHMMNSGPPEVYPRGIDVQSLGFRVTEQGFDRGEAFDNGVVVEEVPTDAIATRKLTDPYNKDVPLMSILEYNRMNEANPNRKARTPITG